MLACAALLVRADKADPPAANVRLSAASAIVLSYIRLGSWLLFSHAMTWEAAYVAAENRRSDRS
jgi:hypothetical protein